MDYLHGNTGVILSLLEQKIDKKYDYLFENWLSTVEDKKEKSELYLKWEIELFSGSNEYKKGYCLGLSHGMPSIVLVLIKLYKRTKSKTVLEYIEKGVSFLMSNQFEDGNEFTFPCTIIEKEKSEGRLAWCYGDLGVALSLYLYGKYFKNEEISSLALTVFTKNCSKRDYKKFRV